MRELEYLKISFYFYISHWRTLCSIRLFLVTSSQRFHRRVTRYTIETQVISLKTWYTSIQGWSQNFSSGGHWAWTLVRSSLLSLSLMVSTLRPYLFSFFFSLSLDVSHLPVVAHSISLVEGKTWFHRIS